MGQDSIYKFLSKKGNIGKWFLASEICKALKVTSCDSPIRKLFNRGEIRRESYNVIFGRDNSGHYNSYVYSVRED